MALEALEALGALEADVNKNPKAQHAWWMPLEPLIEVVEQMPWLEVALRTNWEMPILVQGLELDCGTRTFDL